MTAKRAIARYDVSAVLLAATAANNMKYKLVLTAS